MERITRGRAIAVALVFCMILGAFVLKLYDLQIVETAGKGDNVKTFTTYTTVKAARGEILDCNGNVLVTNRASYDLVFNHYVICSAKNTNALLLDLVNLCRELEVTYIDHFPITATAPYEYTLNQYNASWQGYFQAYLPERGNLDSDISAPLLLKKLRDYYRIPETWSDEDARAVLGLRYELDLRQGITNLPNYVFLEDAETNALAEILELGTPGLRAEATTVREYTTKYGAHILGYTGPVTTAQWEETYKHLEGYSLDAHVGQSGLEMAYELILHARDGVRVDETTVDGTVIDSYYKVEPVAGRNVEISIDINLQSTAEEQLAALITELRSTEGEDGSDAEGGSVVVMNVKTGQILACANYPTYDLSTFREDYNDLKEAPFAPLYNRALLAEYPPGSTYKMSMVIAGIESETIDAYTKVDDKGVYLAYASSGFRPTCLRWTSQGKTHGLVNAMTALQDSCNYYFYYLADKMEINDIDFIAKSLGLGEHTGVELFERIGTRANKENKKELYKDDDRSGWYPADQIMASIGQSINRFTPLQMCVYTSTLANRGVRYQATFMSRVLSSDYSEVLDQMTPEIMSELTISDEAYQAYREGMRLVATSGTASRFFKNYPVAVAAKTGTAETAKGVSDNGAFVCYAPYEAPEIAVSVYVEKGGHGSTVAEIGKHVLDAYFSDLLGGDTNPGENQIS